MKFLSSFFGYLSFLKLIKDKNSKKIVFFGVKNYRNYLKLIEALNEQPRID